MAKKKAATAAAAAAKSPTGVQLNGINNNKKWTIGRQLGAGACGGVYEILVNSNGKTTAISTDWVVKVVPVPTITKKKTSAAELNANTLNWESLVYQVHLGTKLRGTYIPQVPNSTETQAYQKGVNGFNCLIMERMECSLMDTIPQLLSSSISSATSGQGSSININIGPIASKLIELCQVIHEKRHLINDVKPDNIMLARTGSKSSAAAVAASRKRPSAASVVVDGIANRIRLVDFGLLSKWQKQDPNGTASLVGNATYASLNMHALTTSSRRDDVEMMLYVICDLVLTLQAHAAAGGKTATTTNNGGSLLPWSKGQSDEEVLEIKQASVENRQSDFYKLLDPTSLSSNKKKSSAASILHQCLEKVWELEFNTKPNYDEFKMLLGKLTVVTARPAITKKKAPPPTKTAAATTTRKSPAAAKRRASTATSPHVSSPTPSSRASNVSSPTPRKRPAARATRSSAAAASASTNNDDSTDDDDEEDPSPPPSTVAARPTRASSARVASSSSSNKKKAAASRTIATQTTTSLADTSNDRKRPAARSARFRGRLSEEDRDESEEELPAKVRKSSREVIDLMDLDNSESEAGDEEKEDDSDVEMEICNSDDNENVQPARPAKKKPALVSVQLSIQTPGFDPHKLDLVEGQPMILGAKPQQTSKGCRLVEVPGVQPQHCRLELLVKKKKVMGITVTSLHTSSKGAVTTLVVDGEPVPSKKSRTCLGRKIALGDDDNATVITIGNY